MRNDGGAGKFRYSIFLLTAIIAFGTFGYSIFEDMPLFDAFYMTIITISTVGFSEIRPLTVVDFIDIATVGNRLGLIMEETLIDSKSRFVGKNLIDSRLRQEFGVIIVAIKKLSGEIADPFNEHETAVISPVAGIVIGRMNLPLVHKGDALFHVAGSEDSVAVSESLDDLKEEISESIPSATSRQEPIQQRL